MNTERIVIAGGPRRGKTTLARKLSPTPRSTDDLIPTHDWSAASEEASKWFDQPGPWVVEGVAVPRALRKWLAANAEGKPCDRAIWLTVEHEKNSAGQAAMAKACRTVWRGIEGELRRRGVVVEER